MVEFIMILNAQRLKPPAPNSAAVWCPSALICYAALRMRLEHKLFWPIGLLVHRAIQCIAQGCFSTSPAGGGL
jgi:hypothetical protein